MFRRILLTALVAGALSGLGISLVQLVTTTPLILHAETFEHAGEAATHAHGGAPPAAVHAHDTGDAADDGTDGLRRAAITALANVIAGVGFGLLLAACFALHGGEVDGRRGVLWGLAGFATFALAPALGLPPEAPGSLAADLTARQGWWVLAAGATALGLWLLVFGRRWILAVLGVAALALPHLAGAPQPAALGGAVPPELAARFAAASLVTSAVFWAMLGWLGGTLYRRFADEAEPRAAAAASG